MNIALFADRDGTLCEDAGYLADPDGMVLIQGAARGVAQLNAAGILVVVVTNQSGVARGFFDEETVRRVNGRFVEMMAAEGARIDAVHYCPHHPNIGEPPYRADCDCRKPGPGMVLRAAKELDIDLAASFVAGDKASDIELAQSAGCPHSILVRTGYGETSAAKLDARGIKPGVTVPTFADAVPWVLERARNSG